MIRYARSANHPAIREINLEAFGQPAEAELVERLRSAEDSLFELVAEQDGRLVGHILFSRLWADRVELFAALGPMAVRPEAQRRGVGKRLLEAGLESARDFGAHGVLVLGHESYYPRFGFSAEAASRVVSPYSGSPAYMGLALERRAFDDPLTVAYPSAFSEL